MVAPGGVVVVHAAGHGLVHHLKGGRLVHLGVVPVNDGQAHAAHTQGGQLQILKRFVDHWYYPFPSHGASHAALPEAAAYCPSGLICSLVLCYSWSALQVKSFFAVLRMIARPAASGGSCPFYETRTGSDFSLQGQPHREDEKINGGASLRKKLFPRISFQKNSCAG